MSDEVKTIEVQTENGLKPEKMEPESVRDRKVYSPRTDIYETADELALVMDIPGVDENSAEITLENNVLTIKAYPAFEQPEGLTLAYAEYGEGDYQRSFSLSGEIDREHIEANVSNGVLTMRLPKAPAARPRKIAVNAG